MSPDASREAARAIWSNWHAGTAIETLPAHCRPSDRRAGYEVQAALQAISGQGRTGWKIAATSAAGQAHIGVSGPIAGRLLADRTHASGAMIRLAGNRMRVAEPEFAFRCGRRLEPRSDAYTLEDVSAAMDALIPAIEVPDCRFGDFANAGEAQLVADNACAHEFVLGEPAAADWRRLDLAAHPVRGSIACRLTREGCGANVLGSPLLALTWLVNELSGLGIALEAGEVVTTGTSMTPLEVVPGDHVIADFGPLGRVEASFI